MSDGTLRIEYVSLGELRRAPRNPKGHDIGALDKSMERFGYTAPVSINEKTGRLVGGHGRLDTLQQRKASGLPAPRRIKEEGGEWKVPVLRGLYFDTDEEAEAYLLADNRITELGGWEDAQLAPILADLAAADALDGVGWDKEDVDELLASLSENGHYEGLTDPDEVPEPPEEPVTRRGDVWLLGRHRLMCGDATSSDDVQCLMAGEKAALLLTDPPYAVAYVDKARDMNRRGYGHSRATLSAAIVADDETALSLWRDTFGVAQANALADDAAWYIWHAPGRAMLDLYNLLVEFGLLHHQTIIWTKQNFVIGRCDYQWKHEPCFYGWIQGHRPPFYGEKNQTTVWDVARDTRSPVHPTQKPVAIFLPPINNHCRRGDLVFDPFAGSGTAVIAAEQAGASCRALEISEAYADVICRRYQQFTGTLPISEETGEEHDFLEDD